MKPIASAAVLIVNNNKVLLGKRLSKHGHGKWAPPGGKLDYFETLEQCAIRETYEETGLTVKNLKQIYTTDNIFKDENFHSISVFFITKDFEGEPKAMEPEKCEEWKWFDYNNLPEDLFLPMIEFKRKFNQFPKNL